VSATGQAQGSGPAVLRRAVRGVLFAPVLARLSLIQRLRHWWITIGLVRGLYRQRHGRYPRLLRPRTFTEKIQWRKLFELDPMHAIFSDKVAVRDFIAARVGSGVLIPVLWVGDDPERIPFDELRPPYIIKSTHASGQSIRIADDARLDRGGAIAECREWLMHPYGLEFGEAGYEFVSRRIIIERMLTDPDGNPPTELRVFVFGGRARMIQTVFVEQGRVVSGAFHDRDWQRLRWTLQSPLRPQEFALPARFDELIGLAERIADGHEFLRVDFYDCADGLRVGEITLYNWSGLLPFNPPEADLILGSHWRIRAPIWRALKAICLHRREIRPPTNQPWVLGDGAPSPPAH